MSLVDMADDDLDDEEDMERSLNTPAAKRHMELGWVKPSDFKIPPHMLLRCQGCDRTFLGSEVVAHATFAGEGCPHCPAGGFGIDLYDATTEQRDLTLAAYAKGEVPERDSILRIEPNDDPDEVTPFEDLDISGLAMLIALRFFVPDMPTGPAPSAVECMTLMCRFPEVRLHGYAFHPEEGGMVIIDGFRALKNEVAKSRWEALRKVLRKYKDDAALFRDNGKELYVNFSPSSTAGPDKPALRRKLN